MVEESFTLHSDCKYVDLSSIRQPPVSQQSLHWFVTHLSSRFLPTPGGHKFHQNSFDETTSTAIRLELKCDSRFLRRAAFHYSVFCLPDAALAASALALNIDTKTSPSPNLMHLPCPCGISRVIVASNTRVTDLTVVSLGHNLGDLVYKQGQTLPCLDNVAPPRQQARDRHPHLSVFDLVRSSRPRALILLTLQPFRLLAPPPCSDLRRDLRHAPLHVPGRQMSIDKIYRPTSEHVPLATTTSTARGRDQAAHFCDPAGLDPRNQLLLRGCAPP